MVSMVHSGLTASIPVADMSAVISRLEAAEAGSRELDALICCALHDGPDWAKDPYYPLGTSGLYSVGHGGPGLTSECYTTSLDAALALAERVLPEETFWDVSHSAIVSGQRLYNAEVFPPSATCETGNPWGQSQSPALALCIAILRAKLDGYEAEGEVNQASLPPQSEGAR